MPDITEDILFAPLPRTGGAAGATGSSRRWP